MKQHLIVIGSDGESTPFGQDANAAFSLEQLQVTINTSSVIAGWHWDRFAAIVVSSSQQSQYDSSGICNISLCLDEGKNLALETSGFLKNELILDNTVLKITGQAETVFVNMDFLEYFSINRQRKNSGQP